MLASITPAPCSVDDAEQPAPISAAERARQRELESYLTAACINSETARLSADATEGIKIPVSSADPVLTALVQLGPTRLHCDRSFLSLIDGRTQYIIAEATQTTSLVPGPAADLYLGVMTMDSSWGVCPNTMNVFTDEIGELAGDTGNIVADKTRYIIRNFLAEDHYRTKPYVKDFPFMRSYFEVPIISPLGYVIGGYCVVDNKLRDDFNDETLRVLTEVSSTIMAHLERVRRQHNNSRSEKLIRGLSTFIQEESANRTSRLNSTVTSPSDRSLETGGRRSDIQRSSPSSTNDHSSVGIQERLSVSTGPTQPSTVSPEPVAAPQTPVESGNNQDVLRAFHRSARLIREAMDMDGIVFLDSYPLGVGNRDAYFHREDGLDPFASKFEESLQHQQSLEPAPVLASSVLRNDTAHDSLNIPEGLLYRTIQRYKQGHVFLADEFGVFEKRVDRRWRDDSNPGPLGEVADSTSTDLSRTSSKSSSTTRDADAAELFEHFPEAKSIIFIPIWHFQKEKWFAAAIGWTKDSRKSFDLSDTTYLSAFANSITAELLRLETLAVSKAKSDFISSISHELRSPLHGVIATADLLRETLTSREELALLEMITSSGNTLLDTMNHLLDHAKINSRTTRRKGWEGKTFGKSAISSEDSHLHLCDLAVLVEGVVQDVVMGYTRQTAYLNSNGLSSVIPHSTIPYAEHEPPPIVLMDIQAGQDWNMLLDIGAWKRIIMNLLGNALKYTPSGSIVVKLSVIQSSNGDKLCFVVQDTGIGMSGDYQKYHLYSPFRQENPLSAGTGLGLSIVQQIVHLQRGTIEIKSQKGVGTNVTVTAPALKNSAPAGDEQLKDVRQLHGLALGIISPAKNGDEAEELSGPQQSLRIHREMLQSSISKMAKDLLGMKVQITTAPDPGIEVYLVQAIDLNTGGALLPEVHKCEPLVIVHAMQPNKNIGNLTGTTLRLPVGPKRLAQALRDALEQPKSQAGLRELPVRTNNPTSIVLPPAPTKNLASEPALFQSLDTALLGHDRLPTPPEDDKYDIAPEHTIEPTPDPPTEPSAAPLPQLSESAIVRTEPPFVLAVDDNTINIRILTTLLTRLKIPYLTASNGLEALQLFVAQSNARRPFDVVLMDVSMPVMDGFAATREIRAFEASEGAGRGKARIVALTGLGSKESEEEAGRAGMDGFLVKPVKVGVLRELLLGQEPS